MRAPTEEEDMIVRKALSGVARMSRRTAAGWEGRYGRGRIVQMLSGSRSQELLSAGLDKLSTYGILKDRGTGYLNALVRSLSDAGLMITQTGEFPVVTLTALGDKVMRGEKPYRLVWPDPEAGRPDTGLKDHGFDGGLYTMLRDLRTKIAKEEESPPYVVFSNKTLEGLVRHQPLTQEDALKIPGVGVVKAQRYLAPFIDAIKIWKRSR